jgi:hypothetical protein
MERHNLTSKYKTKGSMVPLVPLRSLNYYVYLSGGMPYSFITRSCLHVGKLIYTFISNEQKWGLLLSLFNGYEFFQGFPKYILTRYLANDVRMVPNIVTSPYQFLLLK